MSLLIVATAEQALSEILEGLSSHPPQTEFAVLGIEIPSLTLAEKLNTAALGRFRFHALELDEKKLQDQAKTDYLEVQKSLLGLPGGFTSLRHRGRPLYWFIGHSEKSIWSSQLPHQLYQLRRLQACLHEGHYQQVHTFLEDQELREAMAALRSKRSAAPSPRPVLLHAVRYVRALYQECYKLFYKKALLWKHGLARRSYPTGGPALFSQFPVWWEKDDKGRAYDIFFQGLLDATQGPYHKLVRIEYWRNFPPKIAAFKDFLSDPSVLILENYSSFADILALLDPRVHFKMYRFQRMVARTFSFPDLPIRGLVRADVLKGMSNGMLFANLLLDQSLRRLGLGRFTKVFYRMELSPHEKVLLSNIAPTTTSMGLQHSLLGKWFLQYELLETEVAGRMPLPTRILAINQDSKKQFLAAGIPEERIAVIGGIRYRKLFDFDSSQRPLGPLKEAMGVLGGQMVIFYPMSLLLTENLYMLDDLFQALERLEKKTMLVIRTHPMRLNDPAFHQAVREKSSKAPANCQVVMAAPGMDNYDLISLADFVFYSGGTLGIEAMVLGKCPIVYDYKYGLSHNPLADGPYASCVVDGPGQILEALQNGARAPMNVSEKLPRPDQDAVLRP